MDETQPPAFHYEIGRRLRPLRDEGVLLMGTGNLVHDLHTYAWGGQPAEPYDWAVRFETVARDLVLKYDHAPLIDYASLGEDALRAIPTPDHFLPLLYVLGAANENEGVTFPIEGMDGGSVSTLAVRLG